MWRFNLQIVNGPLSGCYFCNLKHTINITPRHSDIWKTGADLQKFYILDEITCITCITCIPSNVLFMNKSKHCSSTVITID